VQIRLVVAAAGIALAGVAQIAALPGPALAFSGCGKGYYKNASGQCVPDPNTGGGQTSPNPVSTPAGAPPGATAICNDGDYSYSTSPSGTCSRHGGVRQWLTR
jgi:hypothetical protein